MTALFQTRFAKTLSFLQPPVHHFSILRLKHAKHSKNDAAHGRCCATVQSLPETKRAAATAPYTIARITGLFGVCCRPCVVTLRFMPKMALLLKMPWAAHCPLPTTLLIAASSRPAEGPSGAIAPLFPRRSAAKRPQ